MIEPFVFNGPTDKLPGAWHQSYPIVMSRLLASLKNTQDSILEIGTDSGFPLLAYRDWFNEAKIVVGLDINPTPKCLVGRSGVQHRQMDAYTMEAVEYLKYHGPFAYICDDGSHFLNHQQFFAEHYCHLLSEDGIGCIEDLQDSKHVAELHAKLPTEFIGFTIDLRRADSRYDSLLWCFMRKGAA